MSDNRANEIIAEAMQTIKGKNYDYLYSLYEQKQKEVEELHKEKDREVELRIGYFMCGVIIGVVMCAIITELLVK